MKRDINFTRGVIGFWLMFILVIGILACRSVLAGDDMSTRLKGRILLQVEDVGQAWYVEPSTGQRAFLGRPDDAFRIMRELGLGISEVSYKSFAGIAPKKLSGKILLRVEANGEAYYVSPVDLKMYYLGRPVDAFAVMRELGLGISNKNLEQVTVHERYQNIENVPENKNLASVLSSEKGNGDEISSESAPLPNPPLNTKGGDTIQNVDDLYQVTKVVDGDTVAVDIDGVKITIRLIGVDTPETVDPRKPVQCFGVEASNFTKTALTGKKVRLEADPSQGELDKYGRLLRYIILEDGRNFNKIIISQGYGHEYTYDFPYKYMDEFKQAENDARINKAGLWADEACDLPNEIIEEPTPTPASTATTNCECSANTKNCDDFQTHDDAQAYYDCCMTQVGSDIHKLDSDSDGVACESLS